MCLAPWPTTTEWKHVHRDNVIACVPLNLLCCQVKKSLQITKSLANYSHFPSYSSSVRRAFDRLVGKNTDEISVAECQIAMSYLGYNHSILSEENIRKILQTHRDISVITATTPNTVRGHHSYGSIFKRQASSSQGTAAHKCGSMERRNNLSGQTINFEEFCVISAYLSVLQQEQNENSCVSPIKGTNLPPPPIYLTNRPGRRTDFLFLNWMTHCIERGRELSYHECVLITERMCSIKLLIWIMYNCYIYILFVHYYY